MRAFVLLLSSIPFAVASFLAPLVCFIWLLFSGGWSPLLLIFLVGLMALMGLLCCLFFAGFFGPLGILGFPLLCSAYVQWDFFTTYRAKFGDSYALPLMLASMALASIPTAALGKGFELQPGVMVFRGMLSLSYGVAAWLLAHGQLSAYWHVLCVYFAALIIAAMLAYVVGDGVGHAYEG
jgi:hypothetical protein